MDGAALVHQQSTPTETIIALKSEQEDRETEIDSLKEIIQTHFREDLRTLPNTDELTLSPIAEESAQTRSYSDESVL